MVGQFRFAGEGGGPATLSIEGYYISAYSRAIITSLATEARINKIVISSVKRTSRDQAAEFFKKHVVGVTEATYKNPLVGKIIKESKLSLKKGKSREEVIQYMVTEIDRAHGGPGTVSRHIAPDLTLEVFDVAHWGSYNKKERHNYLSDGEARRFLVACRRILGMQVERLGHSKELGFEMPQEFPDEMCFHFEVRQPVLENLREVDNIV